MYFLLRKLALSSFVSVFGAIAFTFSAATVLRVQHMTILQPMAVFPWVLLFYLSFLKSPSIQKGLILAFFLSQMFLAGHFQIFVYGVIILLVLTASIWLLNQEDDIKVSFAKLSAVLIFSLILSTVGLLPSIELKSQSLRSEEVDVNLILNTYPLLPKYFLTYLNPFILGSAERGTANSLEWLKVSVFWERTAYIGVIPLILAVASLFFIFKKRVRDEFFYLGLTLVVSIFLSLGRLSPFFFLYIFPPLNMFRVPSRFILFTQLLAVVLAAYLLEKIVGRLKVNLRTPFLLVVILVTVADLFFNWWSYNPIGTFERWFEKPETAKIIDLENGKYRVFTLAGGTHWNEIFAKRGWENQEDNFLFFRNSLAPNSNLLFDVSHLDGYEVLGPGRFRLLLAFIRKNIEVNKDRVVLNEHAESELDLYGVRYLISDLPVEGPGYEKVFEAQKDNFKFFVYESKSPRPRASFYYDWKKIDSDKEYFVVFENVDLEKTVILEKDPGAPVSPDARFAESRRASLGGIFEEAENKVDIAQSDDEYVALDVSSDKSGILVLSDTYYPGWKAKVDGKETEIIRANINSRAVVVPAGDHKVEFSYEPKSFRIGAIISLVSLVIMLVLMIKPSLLSWFILRRRGSVYSRGVLTPLETDDVVRIRFT